MQMQQQQGGGGFFQQGMPPPLPPPQFALRTPTPPADRVRDGFAACLTDGLFGAGARPRAVEDLWWWDDDDGNDNGGWGSDDDAQERASDENDEDDDDGEPSSRFLSSRDPRARLVLDVLLDSAGAEASLSPSLAHLLLGYDVRRGPAGLAASTLDARFGGACAAPLLRAALTPALSDADPEAAAAVLEVFARLACSPAPWRGGSGAGGPARALLRQARVVPLRLAALAADVRGGGGGGGGGGDGGGSFNAEARTAALLLRLAGEELLRAGGPDDQRSAAAAAAAAAAPRLGDLRFLDEREDSGSSAFLTRRENRRRSTRSCSCRLRSSLLLPNRARHEAGEEDARGGRRRGRGTGNLKGRRDAPASDLLPRPTESENVLPVLPGVLGRGRSEQGFNRRRDASDSGGARSGSEVAVGVPHGPEVRRRVEEGRVRSVAQRGPGRRGERSGRRRRGKQFWRSDAAAEKERRRRKR